MCKLLIKNLRPIKHGKPLAEAHNHVRQEPTGETRSEPSPQPGV